MKVLLCSRGYHPNIAGGAEISTQLTAEGLSSLGVDTHVLTFRRRGDADESPDRVETINGVFVHRVAARWPYWSIDADCQSSAKKLLWHLRQSLPSGPSANVRNVVADLRADIVHTSTIEDFGVGLWRYLRAKKIPTVHTLRSYHLLHRGATLYDAKRDRSIDPDALAIFKRRASSSIDHVIGISRHILKRHLDAGFFAGAGSSIIGNPVPDLLADSESAGVTADQDLFRFGYLGRISPEKGLQPLLSVLRKISPSEHWQIKIAGTGPEPFVSDLRGRFADLPIAWLGHQDPRLFLAGIDVLLVPSRWEEPFGRIIIEANAMGVPVACLDRGGMPELIQNGINGWVFDEWTCQGIAHVQKECHSMNRKTIQRSVDDFSASSIAQQHLQIYEQLLK